jgi:hypothetical protein
MPKLYETLSPGQQLQLAVRIKSPAHLAQTFAAFVGQFYDRSDFDRLAREVHDLYAARSEGQADVFRRRLDQRLHDRYREPVAWDIGPQRSSRAA